MKLDIRDVSKRFVTDERIIQALMSSNFTVDHNDFIVFLGPSGCGKSTLLNIISGLEDASSGQVILDGDPITGPSPEIGMVFQQYTLFPWLTVRQNAMFAAQLSCNGAKGQLENDRPRNIIHRAQKLLKLVGLENFSNAYPHELSGGMQQRLAIVRALANRPKVLLMDEPFGALDSQTREELQDMIQLLSQVEKITVMFVTHDVDEAIYLANRVMVFSQSPGRIIEEVRIPFGPTRDPALKLSEEFLAIKKNLKELINQDKTPSYSRKELLELISHST
ncbi:MAG: ABC transporter ATP-binding protein [Gammaproteobacteria bacterium]|nr:ABC transporter ATP-binding protein [Gammaproteobacteria bacterium]